MQRDEHLQKLIGKEVTFTYSDQTIESAVVDTDRMHQLIGETRTDWRDGMRRMIENRHPELSLNPDVQEHPT